MWQKYNRVYLVYIKIGNFGYSISGDAVSRVGEVYSGVYSRPSVFRKVKVTIKDGLVEDKAKRKSLRVEKGN